MYTTTIYFYFNISRGQKVCFWHKTRKPSVKVIVESGLSSAFRMQFGLPIEIYLLSDMLLMLLLLLLSFY